MKKRKLALLLAAAMTASTIGSSVFASAAELQEAEILEIADGEETIAADEIVPDEAAPEVTEIVDAGDVISPDTAAEEDAMIEEEDASAAAEAGTEDAGLPAADEITIDSIDVATAEEEITLDSDNTISADLSYNVTEGTGLYDADVKGDVFLFTAPAAGVYKARLNVNDDIYLYRSGQDYYETDCSRELVFDAQANETVELRVNCAEDDYLKYRMTFERIPAVTGISAQQTGTFTTVIDDNFSEKFSATITYENGKSLTFDNLYGSDEYGYGISCSVKNAADEYVNWSQPGSYIAELYVHANGYYPSTLKVRIPFTVNAFNPAAYQAIALDTSYQVPAEPEYTWFTFTPAESGSYRFSVDDSDSGYDVYTRETEGLQWTDISEGVTVGTTYLVRMRSYGTAYSFQIKKRVSSSDNYPDQSTSGELTLNTPISGCYAYDNYDQSKAAVYTFTPQVTGDYILSVDVTSNESDDEVAYRIEQYDASTDSWSSCKDSSDYDPVITYHMEQGVRYCYKLYGWDKYKFDAVLTQKKRLVDLYIAEKPAKQSFVRGLDSVDSETAFNGMKVVLTYADDTTVTAVYENWKLVDEQGKTISGLIFAAYEQNNSVKITVSCDGYSDYITIPLIAPEAAGFESIACNVQNTLTLPANTHSKIYQFTSTITGEYKTEVSEAAEDSRYDYSIEIRDEKGSYVHKLESGKTYYVKVFVRNHNEGGDDVLSQDTTISLYVGDPDQACVFAVTSETPATCTAAGQRVYTCTRHAAHEIRTEVIPKLDHVKDAGTVTVQPTCTSEGTRVYTCTLCHNQLYSETISKLDHTSDQGKVTTQPTALKEGVKTYTCTSCGKVLSNAKIAKLKATMKVTADSLKLKVGQSTKKFKVTGLAKGDYVKYWKTNDKSVVTVSGTKKGTCTIKATKKAGSATITIFLASGKTKDIKVTVQKTAVATTKITGVASKLTLKKGKSTTLKPVLSPITSVEKITYTTSDKKIATVSSKGKIVGKKKGTATITVKAGKKSVKCKVTVK